MAALPAVLALLAAGSVPGLPRDPAAASSAGEEPAGAGSDLTPGGPVPAAPLPGVIRRWGLWVGGYLTQFDTRVSWSEADGALVESDFDTDIYKLSFIWQFVSRPRIRIGFTAGLSAFDLSGSIRGIATLSGGPGDAEFREEERESLVAPVPLLGLIGSFSATRRLLIRAQGQIFDLEAGKWDAEVVDTSAVLESMITEHVALGGGYDYYDLSYRQDKKSLAVKYQFDGLVGYVRIVY